MELEFDKEIDAILRRGRKGTTGAATGEHLDADAIAAFAEGVLPERVKPLYTRHIADCDRCRKLLSQAIAMNTAAPLAADGAASSATHAVSESASWLSNLFRTPSFAVAMGALVLVFGGALGYIVLRNQGSGDAAMVSQSETEMQKGGPSAGIEGNEAMANSNAASPATNTTANLAASNATASSASTNSAFGDVGRTDSITSRSTDNLPSSGRDPGNTVLLDGVTAAEPKPSGAAAPPPAPTSKTVGEKDADKLKSDDKAAKDENVLLGGVRQETEDRRASANVTKAKKAPSDSTRSGPIQNQPQINTQTYEMPVTRTAGGKKFTNRNGAWYDTAYRGQATTNVRRGTDTYKNLDSGLRSIAETLGGTVVVVWKDKAYRIQ